MIRIFGIILISIFFLGCEVKENRPIVVSTNLWIGYSPLYYANKRGWLRQNNIKLVRTVSLGESFDTFAKGSADVFCGTQYEIRKFCSSDDKTDSVILLNRSNGGDMILSNLSIEELKSQEKIDVYLELDSVNLSLFEYFKNKYSFGDSQINFIDKTPDISSKLRMKQTATIIVTYSPYNLSLVKNGYKEIASTRDTDLLVLDAIYIKSDTVEKFSQEIDRLNFLVAKSLSDLKSNPKEYFNLINEEFRFENYDEFREALSSIEWIYDNHSIVAKQRKILPNHKKPNLIKPYQIGG